MTSDSALLPATVLKSSRRFITLLTEGGEVIEGQLSSKTLEATVGDRVHYDFLGEVPFVRVILPSRNELTRSYRDENRKIAANVDHLLVITAHGPTFNTISVDRMLAIATLQGFPASLVVNKQDLQDPVAQELEATYRAVGIQIFPAAIKLGVGLKPIEDLLHTPALKTVVLAGVSGVGKSTLLNKLIPGAAQRTNEVSERTGQGKQTTTQPIAYLYPRPPGRPLMLVDLPGIQFFGITQLSVAQVGFGFPEIASRMPQCKFSSNCKHQSEPGCAVKDAVNSGEISESRYWSFLHMVSEIESYEPY